MSKNHLPRALCRMISVALIAAQAILALPAFAQEVHHFDVNSASPATAIQSFGQQSGVQILASADELAGKRLNPVAGDLTTAAAFQKLLAGTGLSPQYVGDRSVALVANKQNSQASAPTAASSPSDNNRNERKKDTSSQLRVAQATPWQAQGDVSVAKPDEQKKPKPAQLEEIVVTGSRIPTPAGQSAQEVKVYTREQIERSGRTAVSDFLNALPEVSVAVQENGQQTYQGGTTVRLHGLPFGTTLVLINGRRVETSGAQGFNDFFDLNSIPLQMVERFEVVSQGSSAIYGSDAIAGVVNIILRKDFDGLEINGKYGFASNTHEWNGSLAWGQSWEKGSISIIGTYQTRTELEGFDRSLTANNDYRTYGGIDARLDDCNPGNVFTTDGSPLPGSTSSFAAISQGATGNPRQTGFQGRYGSLNTCSLFGYLSIIPATNRGGLLASGSYHLTPIIELFSELMYSHVRQNTGSIPPLLFGLPGFAIYTVPTANPYNPFGETVGVSELFTSLGRSENRLDTDFFRALLGARGNFLDSWHWELATWEARDNSHLIQTNQLNNAAVFGALFSTAPNTALNPFVAGPPGSQALLNSLVFDQLTRYSGQTVGINGYVRGSLLRVPSGSIDVVVGSEYSEGKIYSDQVNSPYYPPNTQSSFRRDSYAVFGEMKIPIVANRSSPTAGDRLAISLADRYDRYNDFGSKVTPQLGGEWRPVDSLLIRGTYGQAFKAPSLTDLHMPVLTVQNQLIDPLRGNQPELVTVNSGGNPGLRAETGRSHTLGLVYANSTRSVQLSGTFWHVDERNSIQALTPQAIIDNESLFPGRVVRGPSVNGQPGPITHVNSSLVNFGELSVSGVDYRASYELQSAVGTWRPSLAATQTTHYSVGLAPGAPASDRLSKASDDGNFAPRWKATAAVGWNFGPYSANVAGRYVSSYQDYDSTRTIGNIVFIDGNFRYGVGQGRRGGMFRDRYLEVGAVNLFNRMPQYSNFAAGDIGYDPAESDIRGRFMYVNVQSKW